MRYILLKNNIRFGHDLLILGIVKELEDLINTKLFWNA